MPDYRTDTESKPGLLLLGDDNRIESVDEAAARMLDIDLDETLTPATVSDEFADAMESVSPAPAERNDAVFTAGGGRRIRAVASNHSIGSQSVTAVRLEPLSGNHEVERRLGALADASKRFLEANSKAEIAETGVTAAADAFELEMAHIYAVDEDRVLRPLAATENAKALLGRDGGLPAFEKGNGMLWQALETGSPRFIESVADEEMASDLPIDAAMILPIGDDAVLGIPSTESAEFTSFDRYCAGILARLIAAAFVSVERKTEVAAREAELVRQNDRLEEFARVVSHDLRNPLNVATGRVEMARNRADTEPLDAAVDALDRMEALIEDALTLARGGADVGDQSAVSLAEVAAESWQTVATADATLSVGDVDGVHGDRGRLQSLFENLYRNAIEHAGEEVTVRVEPTETGFVVADDGPGLPDDISNPFKPGQTSTSDGTGFGLAIVRRIAQAHGWVVRVAESDQGGAKFAFETGASPEP
jgi:K+-sensing histidine kinase KdpD